MEWVETTGKTVEAAKEIALDQLGVDEEDAEFEIVEEPRRGLFGRSEARVRARVRPRTPRPKDERRDRRRRSRVRRDHAGNGTDESATGARRETGGAAEAVDGGVMVVDEMSLSDQADLALGFVKGLVEAFGVNATVSRTLVESDDVIEVSVTGDDLGLLIGPKGQTLQAIEELARTVVQRNVAGHHSRLHIDVAGYRQKRREALQRFTRQMAEQVLSTDTAVTLEPMNPSDRKVVHDTVNLIEGVVTSSEGEEPRRRVVISPERAAAD